MYIHIYIYIYIYVYIPYMESKVDLFPENKTNKNSKTFVQSLTDAISAPEFRKNRAELRRHNLCTQELLLK